MDKKNVVVTGGAGFIGSFLCEALLRAGNRVICLDDFSTGNVGNIEPMLRNPDFQFLRLDINQPFDLESFPELEPFKVRFLGIKEVYHLAMPTSVKQYEKFKLQTLLCNSVGTRNVLDMAVKYKAKTLLASTGAVYGARATAGAQGVAENELGVIDHLSSRAALHEGKRFAETMFATYGDVFGLDYRIARIFRTYGPRMPLFNGHQIPDFVLNVLDGKPITVMGDAQTTTALVYVTDVVDGLLRLMKADKGIGPVNIGNEVELNIAEVAQMIMRLGEVTVDITYEPAPSQVVPLVVPDLQKAKQELGWLPLVRLEDGLKKTIDYIRANKILLTNSV